MSDSSYGEHLDIWWTKEYGIDESWTGDRISTDYIPLDLVSYNPKQKKFKKVNVYGVGNETTRYIGIPSFYSLKTIMGESFQVPNVYPKTEIV